MKQWRQCYEPWWNCDATEFLSIDSKYNQSWSEAELHLFLRPRAKLILKHVFIKKVYQWLFLNFGNLEFPDISDRTATTVCHHSCSPASDPPPIHLPDEAGLNLAQASSKRQIAHLTWTRGWKRLGTMLPDRSGSFQLPPWRFHSPDCLRLASPQCSRGMMPRTRLSSWSAFWTLRGLLQVAQLSNWSVFHVLLGWLQVTRWEERQPCGPGTFSGLTLFSCLFLFCLPHSVPRLSNPITVRFWDNKTGHLALVDSSAKDHGLDRARKNNWDLLWQPWKFLLPPRPWMAKFSPGSHLGLHLLP